jgi:hypothetical protein
MTLRTDSRRAMPSFDERTARVARLGQRHLPVPSAAEEAEAAESETALRRVLRGHPVVALRVAGHSCRDAALALGLRPSGLKSRLQRVRAAVRRAGGFLGIPAGRR